MLRFFNSQNLRTILAISLLFPFICTGSTKTLALKQASPCQKTQSSTNFLVMAGGGAPSYNEIALEKNVLYFQRTLQTMGFNAASASVYFANGNDGQATVRYIDNNGNQQFKVPQIPHLSGAATLKNFQNWFQQTLSKADKRPIFFYFTGHGSYNSEDDNNNTMIFWEENLVSVQDFASILDKMPQDVPVVTMMAQCFSGSFANFIYEKGDPKRPVALQTRCGFFATIKTRPSVGCTPEVNEADYRDYSSSFFAGLSGRDRLGNPVSSADYNKNGKVSYAEAHAFAKVDEKTTDLPVSTLEIWLQEQASEEIQQQIISQPINNVLATARPEQQYVVKSLAKMFNFALDKSFAQNYQNLDKSGYTEEKQAYLYRLGMELLNIGIEKQIRTQGNQKAIAIMEKLIRCEGSSWK